jgi:hypothetical protein
MALFVALLALLPFLKMSVSDTALRATPSSLGEKPLTKATFCPLVARYGQARGKPIETNLIIKVFGDSNRTSLEQDVLHAIIQEGSFNRIILTLLALISMKLSGKHAVIPSPIFFMDPPPNQCFVGRSCGEPSAKTYPNFPKYEVVGVVGTNGLLGKSSH